MFDSNCHDFNIYNYSNHLQSKSDPASQPPSSSGVRPQLFKHSKGPMAANKDTWQHGVCAAGRHNRPCSQPVGKYQTPRGIKTSRDTLSKHCLKENKCGVIVIIIITITAIVILHHHHHHHHHQSS